MTAIFVLCSGQEDNIGDVVLRRELLDRLRPHGRLHVFLGKATTDFLRGLDLGEDDVVYTTKQAWRKALWGSIRSQKTWLVDKPGELLLDRRHLLAQVRLASAALAIRARGGRVLRLGLGQRAPHGLFALLHRVLFSISNVVAWRDVQSQRSFGIGEVMPDWGFGERGSGYAGRRDRLALSYRVDRPVLSASVLVRLAQEGRTLGLEPVVVTQVARDEPRSRELAELLQCDLVGWPEGRTHAEQEAALRDVYSGTSIAVSDRLHVLIVAMTEGAVPLCVSEHQEMKVGRHFDAIGYEGVAVRVPLDDADAAAAELRRAAARAAESSSRATDAADRIDAVAARAFGRIGTGS